jgi:hypothetical protein
MLWRRRAVMPALCDNEVDTHAIPNERDAAGGGGGGAQTINPSQLDPEHLRRLGMLPMAGGVRAGQ